jgi:hypothetical protein
MAPYIQPDFRIPAPPTPPTCSNAIHADALQVSTVRTNYVEPGVSDKDDPQRVIRGPKKS